MINENIKFQLYLLGINSPSALDVHDINYWWQKKYSEIKNNYKLDHKDKLESLIQVNAAKEVLEKYDSKLLKDTLKEKTVENIDNDKFLDSERRNFLKFLSSANKSYKLNDYYQAIAYYSKAIELNSGNYSLYEKRGWCKYKLNDFYGSIEDFTKAIEINSGEGRIYSYRAYSKMRIAEYEESLNDCTKAISLDQNNHLFYIQRGKVNSYINNFEDAFNDFTIAKEKNPNSYDAFVARGNLEIIRSTFNRGSVRIPPFVFSQAIKDFEKALGLNSKRCEAYIGIGEIAKLLRDEKKAIEFCTKAIKIDNKNSKAYRLRGEARQNIFLYKDAIKDYKKTLTINPYDSVALYQLDYLSWVK